MRLCPPTLQRSPIWLRRCSIHCSNVWGFWPVSAYCGLCALGFCARLGRRLLWRQASGRGGAAPFGGVWALFCSRPFACGLSGTRLLGPCGFWVNSSVSASMCLFSACRSRGGMPSWPSALATRSLKILQFVPLDRHASLSSVWSCAGCCAGRFQDFFCHCLVLLHVHAFLDQRSNTFAAWLAPLENRSARRQPDPAGSDSFTVAERNGADASVSDRRERLYRYGASRGGYRNVKHIPPVRRELGVAGLGVCPESGESGSRAAPGNVSRYRLCHG